MSSKVRDYSPASDLEEGSIAPSTPARVPSQNSNHGFSTPHSPASPNTVTNIPASPPQNSSPSASPESTTAPESQFLKEATAAKEVLKSKKEKKELFENSIVAVGIIIFFINAIMKLNVNSNLGNGNSNNKSQSFSFIFNFLSEFATACSFILSVGYKSHISAEYTNAMHPAVDNYKKDKDTKKSKVKLIYFQLMLKLAIKNLPEKIEPLINVSEDILEAYIMQQFKKNHFNGKTLKQLDQEFENLFEKSKNNYLKNTYMQFILLLATIGSLSVLLSHLNLFKDNKYKKLDAKLEITGFAILFVDFLLFYLLFNYKNSQFNLLTEAIKKVTEIETMSQSAISDLERQLDPKKVEKLHSEISQLSEDDKNRYLATINEGDDTTAKKINIYSIHSQNTLFSHSANFFEKVHEHNTQLEAIRPDFEELAKKLAKNKNNIIAKSNENKEHLDFIASITPNDFYLKFDSIIEKLVILSKILSDNISLNDLILKIRQFIQKTEDNPKISLRKNVYSR